MVHKQKCKETADRRRAPGRGRGQQDDERHGGDGKHLGHPLQHARQLLRAHSTHTAHPHMHTISPGLCPQRTCRAHAYVRESSPHLHGVALALGVRRVAGLDADAHHSAAVVLEAGPVVVDIHLHGTAGRGAASSSALQSPAPRTSSLRLCAWSVLSDLRLRQEAALVDARMLRGDAGRPSGRAVARLHPAQGRGSKLIVRKALSAGACVPTVAPSDT